jgi:chromate transporter
MTAATPRTGQLARYFLELGTTGFGGPIALVARMHRDLVVDRAWITPDEYRDGLAVAQLAPGPLAAQLAMYIGWIGGGARGAALIGAAFILPSLIMVIALSLLYVRFGGMSWMTGAFYGVGAAVIGIIARGAYGLARKTLERDRLLWVIFLINTVMTVVMQAELFSLVAASGIVCVLLRSRPIPALQTPLLVAPLISIVAVDTALGINTQLLLFFAKASLVVFGSGLAVVPFLYGGVVQAHHWLTEQQFLDAVAVSMITPGPVVITVSFIGYLVSGPLGAAAAAIGMFVPVYLTVIIIAPYYGSLRAHEPVRQFVLGVTAAATGAIAGAAIILGQRAITDAPTALLALAVIAVPAMKLRVPEPLLICAAGIVGILLR